MRTILFLAMSLLLSNHVSAFAQSCKELVPDPHSLDRLTGAEASARLVNQSDAAIRVCEAEYETGLDAETGIRLAFALAANKTREAQARAILSRESLNSYPEAVNMLGALYSNGIGGPVDELSAQDLFEKAAANDFALAKYNLAEMLYWGIAGEIDQPRARKLLEEASEADVPEAQALLGYILSAARVGKPDPVKALTLIHLALDAKAVNVLTYASLAYESTVGTVGSLQGALDQYAKTPEDAGRLWQEYLIASGEAGDRQQMILSALVQSYSGFEPRLKEQLLAAIDPPRKEARLHIWVRYASSTIRDSDALVYQSLYNGGDSFKEYLQVDVAPFVADFERRLGYDDR